MLGLTGYEELKLPGRIAYEWSTVAFTQNP